MTEKEKIRAEVERLKSIADYQLDNCKVDRSAWSQQAEVCKRLLSFIDSLQEESKPKFKVGDIIKEKGCTTHYRIDEIHGDGSLFNGDYSLTIPPSEFHNWELVEIQNEDKCKGCNNVKGCVTCVDGNQWAHCVEPKPKFDAAIQDGDDVRYNEGLGCRVNLSQLHRVAQRDRLNQFYKEFDEIIKPYKKSHYYKNLCINLIVWRLNLWRWLLWKAKEEPISKDLEEAAANYEEKMWKKGHPEDTYTSSDIIKAVKYGANWQKEQYINEGISPKDAYFGHLLEESWAAGRSSGIHEYKQQIMKDAEEISLTWKDVRLFESVLEEMLGDRIYGIYSSGISNEQYSKEALRRFKERKVMEE